MLMIDKPIVYTLLSLYLSCVCLSLPILCVLSYFIICHCGTVGVVLINKLAVWALGGAPANIKKIPIPEIFGLVYMEKVRMLRCPPVDIVVF